MVGSITIPATSDRALMLKSISHPHSCSVCSVALHDDDCRPIASDPSDRFQALRVMSLDQLSVAPGDRVSKAPCNPRNCPYRNWVTVHYPDVSHRRDGDASRNTRLPTSNDSWDGRVRSWRWRTS